jgi:LEA14-like dessication related protein
MMAVSYNTVIDQGATWYLTVTYENPNGTPINITGYTAALQLRSLPSDAVAVLSLTTGAGITITGATGTVAITATATQTRAIDEGTYYYDLEITSTLGVVTRLVQGQVVVSPEVTR